MTFDYWIATSADDDHGSAQRPARADSQCELRTVAVSLLGCGHPLMAILNVTQILARRGPALIRRTASVQRAARRYRALDERLQTVARMLATGHSTQEIAAQLSICRKTVGKHRDDVLQRLHVGNATELAILLSRLQEAGLGDFGLPDFTLDQ